MDNFVQEARKSGINDTDIMQFIQQNSPDSAGEVFNSLQKNPSFQMPDDLTKATALIGNQNYDDYCQQFVEQMAYGKSGIYPNAVSAWNDNAQNGNAVGGMDGIKQGDLMYFAPDDSNSYAGHAGIYMGNNQFISATNNGVQTNDLNDWQQSTGQQLLGFVPRGGSQ